MEETWRKREKLKKRMGKICEICLVSNQLSGKPFPFEWGKGVTARCLKNPGDAHIHCVLATWCAYKKRSDGEPQIHRNTSKRSRWLHLECIWYPILTRNLCLSTLQPQDLLLLVWGPCRPAYVSSYITSWVIQQFHAASWTPPNP